MVFLVGVDIRACENVFLGFIGSWQQGGALVSIISIGRDLGLLVASI
jgi:hypothetical protein